MYTNIVLEGSDLTGKTTVFRMLDLWFPSKVTDRSPVISASIGEFDYDNRGVDAVRSNPSTLFVILYTKDVSILKDRLEERLRSDPFKVDDYDRNTALYNNVYAKFGKDLIRERNVLMVSIDKKTSFDVAAEIAQYILKSTVTDLPEVSLEGESKVYRKIPGTGLALVKLKPTLYSFTHNRYGVAEGTDEIRKNFWSLFGSAINREWMEYGVHPDFGLPSSYVTDFTLHGVDYTVVRFWDHISPLEVLWKNYLVGTTKHDLHGVDQYRTRYGAPIQYEGKFPKPIIRFDWRNPLPYQDKCIPDELADFYINTEKAKQTARFATRAVSDLLASKGYELVDLCYFMNEQGTQVCGEISPDGMRIKKQGSSYDKDLWRVGKGTEEICKVWQDMYIDLSSVHDFARTV